MQACSFAKWDLNRLASRKNLRTVSDSAEEGSGRQGAFPSRW